MSDLPKGYLRCTRCAATFPGKTEDGKDVEKCPGCGLSTAGFRLRTARMMMRALSPTSSDLAVLGGPRFGAVEIIAVALIVASILGGVAFVILSRR